ncbi:hypothetical protein QN277_028489 [Acacia crassicarpa]|uniref:Pleiotropic ABC efflux transporter N-terminal domain-containing protein n=1 Tax=Acacia crassicarpa TaxID=499986 RepID=A0AAE1J6M4_9FABA|nr:hypothetical protein QN277_028489 [Acacia crassicarpa]
MAPTVFPSVLIVFGWNSGKNVFGIMTASREGGPLDRLSTYARVRRGIFRELRRVVDVRELDAEERKQLLERLMKSANHDLEKLFDQIRHRFDEVGLGFSKVEVRFEHLRVECFVQVGSRALPTVPNYICNIVEVFDFFTFI